jgi:hypothetical protein
VTILGRRDHLASLSGLPALIALPLIFSDMSVPQRHARYIKRFISELLLFLRNEHMKIGHADCIFMLAGFCSTITALALATLLRRLPSAILIVLHGNATELSWRSRNPISRFFDLTSAIRLGAWLGFTFIVLEKDIEAEVRCLLPELGPRLATLSHPLQDYERAETEVIASPNPVRLGYLGLASAEKGFPIFASLAVALTREHPGTFEFSAIGPLVMDISTIDLSGLTIKPSSGKIPHSEYITAAHSLHYICLPYSATHYRLSASGILLDALALGKPIIAIELPSLRTLFRQYGELGFLCRDEADMKAVIAGLGRSFDAALYRAQVSAVGRAARDRKPEALAERVRSLITARISGSGG